MSNTPPVLWFRVYEYDWIEKRMTGAGIIKASHPVDLMSNRVL